eukprot:scpid66928/ scgid23468/ 
MLQVTPRPVHHQSSFEDFLEFAGAMEGNSMLTGSTSLSNITSSLDSDISSQIQSLLAGQDGSRCSAKSRSFSGSEAVTGVHSGLSEQLHAASNVSPQSCSRLSQASSNAGAAARSGSSSTTGGGFDAGFPSLHGVNTHSSSVVPFLAEEPLRHFPSLQDSSSVFVSTPGRQSCSPLSVPTRSPPLATSSSPFTFPILDCRTGAPTVTPTSMPQSTAAAAAPCSSAFGHLAGTSSSLAAGLSLPPQHNSPPLSMTSTQDFSSVCHSMPEMFAHQTTAQSTSCAPYSPPDHLSEMSESTAVAPSQPTRIDHDLLNPRVLGKEESAHFRKIRSAKREVKRLRLQKEAFQRLSQLLPCDTRRMSRLDLLRQTTEYIRELQTAVEEQKRRQN